MNNLIADYISPLTIARMIIDVENLLELDPYDQAAGEFYSDLNDTLVGLVGQRNNQILKLAQRKHVSPTV